MHDYINRMRRQAADVAEKKDVRILAIETSCDETGVGIVRGETLLVDAIASSVDEHARFGGVVPEVASRAHLEAMVPTIERAARQAGIELRHLDAIAVTSGPGLAGALMVGVASAKALALALRDVPDAHFPRAPRHDVRAAAGDQRDGNPGFLQELHAEAVEDGEALAFDHAAGRREELQAAGDYSEAYFMHGLAVQTAEATAAWLHDRIQKELGRGPRGKRYSWGYGACPDLNDHSVLFDLLPAAQELGMSLTTAFQLVPEQSTAALIVHHPAAKYYVIGGSRVEQLLR